MITFFTQVFMETIERRALYHLLRMNWLNEPALPVEPWQVEDYRSLPLSSLFERLTPFQISLDRISFIAYADECDSPEDLTEHLAADRSLQTTEEDQIYLLVFELWRRLMSEKPSLSILCNELDYQICLYDNQELDNPFGLQDAIAHFVQVLDENVDQGIAAEEAWQLISPYCANDLETFLYDFIAEQIDEDNESYAHELLDDFEAYLEDNKWFKLLRIRLFEKDQSKTAQLLTQEVIEEHLNENDLEFNLEFLSVIADSGDHSHFREVIKQTLPLIKHEEEFQDLLAIAMDFFHRLDLEKQEMSLKTMLDARSSRLMEASFDPADTDSTSLVLLLNLK